jgi:hypothetical protein
LPSEWQSELLRALVAHDHRGRGVLELQRTTMAVTLPMSVIALTLPPVNATSRCRWHAGDLERASRADGSGRFVPKR